MHNEIIYDVMWPRAERGTRIKPLAKRLDSLNGKTVAQLWDFLFQGDQVFSYLEEGLRKRYPDIRFIGWKEFGTTHGHGEKELIASIPTRFKELGIDAVISGMGCCGACTPAVLRASAACESAGIPTSSLVCEGFVGQAGTTSTGLGFASLPLAMVPGHIGNQSNDEIRQNVLEGTLDRVIQNLIHEHLAGALDAEPDPSEVVFTGTFEEVNAYFYANEWSDGLPIIPPTREKIDEFLSFTDRNADDVIGLILPDNRRATMRSIAVNGVMAGCRPEYMPILIALVEAMADPDYGVEHSGNTPGGETLIMLNGPIIKDLEFNYTQGVLRDGFIANTTVGRFFRLYLRNVAGFLPHKNDKATFGNTWRVVLAENEDFVAKIGWEPNSVDMGFKAGDNTVTIARYTGGGIMSSITGTTPETVLPFLCDGLAKEMGWEIVLTVGSCALGTVRPLLLLSPIVAETIARAGWSKQDVKDYLFKHARLTARKVEAYTDEWTDHPIGSLLSQVKLGRIPKDFAESEDPDRLVPIVFEPDDFMIIVTGDPLRTNAYAFTHNGYLGYPTAKKIALPAGWSDKLAEAQKKRGAKIAPK